MSLRERGERGGDSLPVLLVLRNIIWSFCKGFADSLRGAVELFLLDYRRAQAREQKLEQKEIDRELLLNRHSPNREILAASLAKRRAQERRVRAAEQGDSGNSKANKKKEPNILERTVKCCLLNGAVFAMSLLFFENIFLPCMQSALTLFLAGSRQRAELLWNYTEPVLTVAFSTLWVLPFYLLSKIVNAIWFQDIADLAFRSSQGRPLVSLSISVMIADTVFSLVVEVIFLVQGKVCSLLPIQLLGAALNLTHQCLLHSLYSFEYKWFSQGLELHKRLDYIESNWPYFLGFGLPLAVITSMPESQVMAGCVFSVLFPLFIVSGNQASIIPSPGVPPLNIFSPTISISNAVFSRTISSNSGSREKRLK